MLRKPLNYLELPMNYFKLLVELLELLKFHTFWKLSGGHPA